MIAFHPQAQSIFIACIGCVQIRYLNQKIAFFA